MKEITSLQNPTVKHFIKLMHNRDYRDEQQSVVLEGRILVNEVTEKIRPLAVLTTDPHVVPIHLQEEAILISSAISKKIAATEEPEGIFAEVPMPKPHLLDKMSKVLVLDGINEPGNVGALLRSAIAFGWEGVFFLPHCADLFNDKALRAARGAQFKLPYNKGSWEDLYKMAQKNKWKVLGADIEGRSIQSFSQKSPFCLVLGNESHGLSKDVLENCEKITIPITDKMESLNVAVAGGILMYVLGENK